MEANSGNTEQAKLPLWEGIPLDQITELAKSFEEVAIIVRRRNAKGRPQYIPQFNGMRIATLQLADIEPLLWDAAGGGVYEIDCRDPRGSMQVGSPMVLRFKCEVEGAPKPVSAAGWDPRAPVGVGPGAMAMAQQPMLPPLPQGHAPLPFAMPTPGERAWAEGLNPRDREMYLRSFPQQPTLIQQAQPMQNDTALNVALRQQSDLRGELERERATLLSVRASLETERRERQNASDEARRQYERELAAARKEGDDRITALRERHEQETQRLKDKHDAELQRKNDELRRLEDDRRRAETEALKAEINAARESKGDQSQSNMMMLFKTMSDAQEASRREMATLLTRDKPNGMIEMMPIFMKMMEARSPEAQSALLGQLMENQIASMGAMSQLMKEHMGDAPPPWLEMAMKGLETVKNVAIGMMRDNSQNRVVHQQFAQGAVAAQLPPGQAPQMAPLPAAQVAQPMFDPNGFDEPVMVTPAPAKPNGANGHAPIAAPPPASVQLTPELQRRYDAEGEIDILLPMLPADFMGPEWRRILVELKLESEDAPDLLCRYIDYQLEFGHSLPAALQGIDEKPRAVLEAILPWLPLNDNPEYANWVIDTVEAFFSAESTETETKDDASVSAEA